VIVWFNDCVSPVRSDDDEWRNACWIVMNVVLIYD
jgi:hypothetical protein